MFIAKKHFWMSGVWAPPAAVETIIAKDFPMLYLSKPVKAEELRSKIEGATITKVAQEFPELLLKTGKAKELRSRWG
jgi:hypothetical protein